MNYRNAYNGLAATYRNLRKKAAKITTEYGLLKEKYDVLSAKDPQLAYYIDENHRLNTELRNRGLELDKAYAQVASAEEYAECLRKLTLKRTEELEKAQFKYKCTFIIWAVADALVLGALAYLYLM